VAIVWKLRVLFGFGETTNGEQRQGTFLTNIYARQQLAPTLFAERRTQNLKKFWKRSVR
jgi:hypothetical protein